MSFPLQYICLVLERNALCILVDVAAEDHDSLDKSPNSADKRSDSAKHNANCSQKQLSNRFSRIAEIEVMNSPRANQNTQNSCRNLGFLLRGIHLCCGCRGATASTANNRLGHQLISAVGAKASAGSFLESAHLARDVLGLQLISAILTKHHTYRPFLIGWYYYSTLEKRLSIDASKNLGLAKGIRRAVFFALVTSAVQRCGRCCAKTRRTRLPCSLHR